MLERGKMERGIFEIVDTESLVPAEHLLRKIDAAVNFNKIYDMVEPLYCADNGRPSVDPVVLFKMVLIQHLYGLGSLRRTAEEVSFNVAYRWFLGYRLQEDTPHFSTISYNFRHRFTSETVDQIFSWILMEMVEAGYVAPGVVFVDGTHPLCGGDFSPPQLVQNIHKLPSLCGDGKATTADLLGVSLVEFGQNFLEGSAVESLAQDRSPANDVLTRNQFFYLSGFHLCLDGVADGIGFPLHLLNHGFVFVQQFNLGKQFDFRHFGNLLCDVVRRLSSCHRSFVFDVGLTTGGVEIGLSLIAPLLYYEIRNLSIRFA